MRVEHEARNAILENARNCYNSSYKLAYRLIAKEA